MSPEQLEQLLYEEEGPTLDFKRDQYLFSKTSDEVKSELLKDIIGFANSWRRAEGFILIGVKEVQGGRSIVHGITDHLQDHTLQQFVNNLTNRPVRFCYEACEIEGKQVGIIRIELQKRPIYLKRDYGKLKKGEVYVRRGSSTDPSKPADPDEIAHMGSETSSSTKEATLVVEFAELNRERVLGEQIEWTAEYCEVPSTNEIPKLAKQRPGSIQLPGLGKFHIPDYSTTGMHDQLNTKYYHELANYVFIHRLVRKIRLVITNTGNTAANDVRLEICVPNGSGFGILRWSDIPDAPKKRKGILDISMPKHIRRAFQHVGAVDIEKTDHETKMEIDCGNLQPGRKVWTDEFHLAVIDSGEVKIQGNLYAANLSQPQTFVLSINALITRTRMTVDELTALDEPEDDED